MTEQNRDMFDEEFLHLHREVLFLTSKFIKRSHWIFSYIDKSNSEQFVKKLSKSIVEGFVEADEETFDLQKDMLFKRKTSVGRRILESKYNKDLLYEYLFDIVSGRKTDIVELYFEFDKNLIIELVRYCSPPMLLQGMYFDCTKRKVHGNTLVTLLLDGTESYRVFWQASLTIKQELYEVMSLAGNIYNPFYMHYLEERGLLWGVPPLPNKKFTQELIKNLKSKVEKKQRTQKNT